VRGKPPFHFSFSVCAGSTHNDVQVARNTFTNGEKPNGLDQAAAAGLFFKEQLYILSIHITNQSFKQS
jgi:hypothetical protein